MNAIENQADSKQDRIRKRPFFCRIILSMALTYFLILALLLLAGFVFSGTIIEAIRNYYDPEDISPVLIRWSFFAASSLYLLSVAGIILFMLNRKGGFFIFFLAAVIIFSLDLAFFSFDWLRYLIHTGFIFILGIAHFSKRCYH
jgi:hypothetical protein